MRTCRDDVIVGRRIAVLKDSELQTRRPKETGGDAVEGRPWTRAATATRPQVHKENDYDILATHHPGNPPNQQRHDKSAKEFHRRNTSTETTRDGARSSSFGQERLAGLRTS